MSNTFFTRTLLHVMKRTPEAIFVSVATSEWRDYPVAIPLDQIEEDCRDVAVGETLIGYANTGADSPRNLKVKAESLEMAPAPLELDLFRT
jgi:hypothetical protein